MIVFPLVFHHVSYLVWVLRVARSIIQFQYGEDGIDVSYASFFKRFPFLAANAPRIAQMLDLEQALKVSSTANLTEMETKARKLNR